MSFRGGVGNLKAKEAAAKEILAPYASDPCAYCGRDHDIRDCHVMKADMHIAGQLTGHKRVF